MGQEPRGEPDQCEPERAAEFGGGQETGDAAARQHAGEHADGEPSSDDPVDVADGRVGEQRRHGERGGHDQTGAGRFVHVEAEGQKEQRDE